MMNVVTPPGNQPDDVRMPVGAEVNGAPQHHPYEDGNDAEDMMWPTQHFPLPVYWRTLAAAGKYNLELNFSQII
jgi:hypothetical protein